MIERWLFVYIIALDEWSENMKGLIKLFSVVKELWAYKVLLCFNIGSI